MSDTIERRRLTKAASGRENPRKTHTKITNAQTQSSLTEVIIVVLGNNAYKLDISRADTKYDIKDLFGKGTGFWFWLCQFLVIAFFYMKKELYQNQHL